MAHPIDSAARTRYPSRKYCEALLIIRGIGGVSLVARRQFNQREFASAGFDSIDLRTPATGQPLRDDAIVLGFGSFRAVRAKIEVLTGKRHYRLPRGAMFAVAGNQPVFATCHRATSERIRYVPDYAFGFSGCTSDRR